MAYTKLFSSIVTSTIWLEPDETRLVWITMLALADKNGEVQAAIPGLARIAGVSVESCRKAIASFLSPDPDSRTKDEEGRRIEEIQGGWWLINHAKYTRMASLDEMAEKNRERQARHRDKVKRNGGVTHSNENVTEANVSVTHRPDTHTHTHTDTHTTTLKKTVGHKAPKATDEEWIKELEGEPAYHGINIRTELGKMQRWCNTNGKQPSRKRFVNWLNRADKPITTNGNHQPEFQISGSILQLQSLREEVKTQIRKIGTSTYDNEESRLTAIARREKLKTRLGQIEEKLGLL